MKKIFTVIVLCAIFFQVNAQEKWSLQKCIDYALANNIVIKQYHISSQYQQNELNQAKYDKLPSLSASASQSINFGRSENIEGTYDDYTSATTAAEIETSVLIWQCGILKNTVRQNEYSFKASLEDLKKAKNDVTLNIASAYLDILLAKELVKVAENQAEQTKKQIERTKKLIEAGKVAEGTLLEIQAQLASEELDVVNNKNDLKIACLNLAQLLELDDYTNFDVEVPDLPELRAQMSLTNSVGVYTKAVAIRPEIKSAEYDLKNAEVQLDIAKGAKWPALSAYAGIANNYYNYENAPAFSDQFSGNLSEYMGLSLSIPIFSQFENKTNIANSKLQITNNELELESAKKTLRKQIEQAYTNAVAAMERYNANKIAVKSMEESFRYIEEKYNVGRVNSVEYNDAKTNLADAQSSLIQAKYEFIFRTKILDFYNGIPIRL